MMASTLLSRLIPSATGSPSVYEAIREHEQALIEEEPSDYHGIDEQNLDARFTDQDLDHVLADAAQSQFTSESTAILDQQHQQRHVTSERDDGGAESWPRWMQDRSGDPPHTEEDDDVPESLLLEDARQAAPSQAKTLLPSSSLPPPIPGPSNRSIRVQWDTTRAQQLLHDEELGQRGLRSQQIPAGPVTASSEEKAMWRWTNTENLDNFLKEVYDYYVGRGIWSVLLARVLELLTFAFVVGFGTFMMFCIDYGKIPGSKALPQVIVQQCTKEMSRMTYFFIWLFLFLWIYKLFQYLLDIRRLWHLHDFYLYLLGVTDLEVQTISWQEIVGRLMDLRNANPRTALDISQQTRKFIGDQSKQRMDAHDIANRLMRRDNYLIALFNKDVLDLKLPIPLLKTRQLFSKTLEWYIDLCVTTFVFNEQGQVKQLFLKESHRSDLIQALRHRFLIAGFISVVSAPFIVIYYLMLYFLRYFTEFQRNPSQLSSRSYTPLAEWKFREFNELKHLFKDRMDMSYPFASRYIDQFPKDKTIQIARFVAFIAGALAAVLAVASLLDPDLFLGFEITADRTVLFYLGVLGSIWAVARGLVPDENTVFDPEYAINAVIKYTRYMPNHWTGRLHSDDVRRDFSTLYQMKVLIFLEEVLSMAFTPFVLWFSLPNCSERLIDFFREFTVHVDGLGYVCSFALFDFKTNDDKVRGNKTSQPEQYDTDPRGDYYSTKDGKLKASYFGFMDSYANYSGSPHQRRDSRKSFHPPPAFPGIMEGPPAVRDNGLGKGGNQGKQAASRFQSKIISPVDRSPNRRLRASHASPSPSLILDPDHHPSMSMSRRMPFRSAQSRHRLQKPQLADYSEVEEEEEAGPSDARQSDVFTSVVMDSNLGDSWKTTRAALDSDAAADFNDPDDADGDRGGVLGMLYQFQKAQAEGKGAGVNI